MKKIILILALIQSNIALAENISCKEKFTGFFEREFISVPELGWKEKNELLGKAILDDLATLSPINPDSEIAKQEFYGAGKCFTLSLEDAATVGALVQLDFSITYISLKNDRSITWFLNYFTMNELISPTCENTLLRLQSSSKEKLASMNAYFENGAYVLKLADRLDPIRRQLFTTANGNFLISKTYAGMSPIPHAVPLYSVCAYPKQ